MYHVTARLIVPDTLVDLPEISQFYLKESFSKHLLAIADGSESVPLSHSQLNEILWDQGRKNASNTVISLKFGLIQAAKLC